MIFQVLIVSTRNFVWLNCTKNGPFLNSYRFDLCCSLYSPGPRFGRWLRSGLVWCWNCGASRYGADGGANSRTVWRPRTGRRTGRRIARCAGRTRTWRAARRPWTSRSSGGVGTPSSGRSRRVSRGTSACASPGWAIWPSGCRLRRTRARRHRPSVTSGRTAGRPRRPTGWPAFGTHLRSVDKPKMAELNDSCKTRSALRPFLFWHKRVFYLLAGDHSEKLVRDHGN